MIVNYWGAKDWIVSANRLEYRYGSQKANPRKSRKYTDGAWHLRRVEGDGAKYWQLSSQT